MNIFRDIYPNLYKVTNGQTYLGTIINGDTTWIATGDYVRAWTLYINIIATNPPGGPAPPQLVHTMRVQLDPLTPITFNYLGTIWYQVPIAANQVHVIMSTPIFAGAIM